MQDAIFMLLEDRFYCSYNIKGENSLKKFQLYSLKNFAVLLHKEYAPYALILFLGKHESAKPHVLSLQWKVVDTFFFLSEKRPKPKFWQAQLGEFFQLLFWGILPSFSAYAAFLFIPFRAHGRKQSYNFRLSDGER